jgi:hypothetical protein
MRTIRTKATIKGVETEMLFTPRLFEFATATMDFSGGSAAKVSAMYADIAYCAALNIWTLNENAVDDFRLDRVAFHEWAAQEPKEFGKVMKVALEALTNKSLEELLKENDGKKAADPEVKKKTSSWITRLLRRS